MSWKPAIKLQHNARQGIRIGILIAKSEMGIESERDGTQRERERNLPNAIATNGIQI